MLANSPQILVIGYNAFDITVPFDQYPELDSKTEVGFIGLAGGGPGATAAIAMARLGASVKLVTPLTDDVGGMVQKEELEQAGVDISLSVLMAGHECAKAVILARPVTGERTIFWSRQNLPHLDKELWQDCWLDGMDLLYLDGHEPALSLMAAQKAKERNIRVVFDAGSVREGSKELAALCTDVISSATFATELTGIDDCAMALKKLKEQGPSRVAMTFGCEGVVALEHKLFSVPSFKINAVDTTGAGDVFHAGYAYSMACGGSFYDNLTFAAAVSAIKCEFWGARGGLPSIEEAQHMVETGVLNILGPKCQI